LAATHGHRYRFRLQLVDVGRTRRTTCGQAGQNCQQQRSIRHVLAPQCGHWLPSAVEQLVILRSHEAAPLRSCREQSDKQRISPCCAKQSSNDASEPRSALWDLGHIRPCGQQSAKTGPHQLRLEEMLRFAGRASGGGRPLTCRERYSPSGYRIASQRRPSQS